MDDNYKAKEQLLKELEEMRLRLKQLEDCRKEFQGVRSRYEKLLESAPDALVFVNSDYEIILVNAQMERLFGYTQEELAGKKLDILIPERFRERHRKNVADFLVNPRVRSMGSGLKIFGLKKDGTEFRADISLSPLMTDEGLLATAAIRDVTDQVEAHEQIERNYHIQRVISSVLKISLEHVPLSEQLDRALDLILSVPHLSLESKGSVYLVKGEPGDLVLIARRGAEGEAFSCEREQIRNCICDLARATCGVVFSECSGKSSPGGEEIFPHGHYCVPIAFNGRALGVINVFLNVGHPKSRDEEEFLIAVANTLAGIIRHHQAESERDRLREQLAQHEKLAALGRITANVAHEIRNPLTSVGGFARRLQKIIPDNTKEKGYAEYIISEVKNLEGVLRDVLAYSRVSVPRIEKHDIHGIIDGVLEIFEEAFRGRSVTVQKSFGTVPALLIDRELTAEALGNVVSNALDAMPAGGTLTISTAVKKEDSAEYVVVSIKDTGEGIPDDKIGLVFEPFFTTRVARKGIGLGLPISKKIMEEHGGVITVESRHGEGAVFRLYFPCSTDQH